MEKEKEQKQQPAEPSQGGKKKSVNWWLKLIGGIAEIAVTIFGKKKV